MGIHTGAIMAMRIQQDLLNSKYTSAPKRVFLNPREGLKQPMNPGLYCPCFSLYFFSNFDACPNPEVPRSKYSAHKYGDAPRAPMRNACKVRD
jgi:hypothetical protein